MAKIKSIGKLNWGGFDPSQINRIEIEMKEVIKTDSEVIFEITDTVIAEINSEDNEGVYEYPYQIIRQKKFKFEVEQYNQLFELVDSEMPLGLTPLERESLRPKMALLYYFTQDVLDNELCGYNTNPNDWEIV